MIENNGYVAKLLGFCIPSVRVYVLKETTDAADLIVPNLLRDCQLYHQDHI